LLYAFLFLLLAPSLPAMACTTCNRPLQTAIFDAGFTKLFFFMLLPFALVWVVVSRLNKLK
ncbi:hypothetical protein OB13_13140, partial [Pontibacter sp. HJ8]